MIRLVVLSIVINYGICAENLTFLGCYKDVPNYQLFELQNYELHKCISQCRNNHYRYSIVQDPLCYCGNNLGESVSNNTCSEYCRYCKEKPTLTDIYATGNLANGPPKNVQITNITDHSLRISWERPDSFLEITSYQIKAKIIHTYSSYSPVSPEWIYSNNTFHTNIITLMPATKYNITVGTKASYGDGAVYYQLIQTKLQEPDNVPEQPEIIERDGTTMKIKLTPVVNNNGPITSYRIVIVNDDAKENFEKDKLFGYNEAKKNEQSYYIAAEISPNDVNKEFTVGDGLTYGNYYNAPLESSTNYVVILGVVSILDEVTETKYSVPDNVIFLNVDNEDISDPALIIGLSIAIGLLSCLFVVAVIGFLFLRSKVTNRRQRLSDNQELTLQGPMIEVENNGYIPEEEHVPINHYKSLKQKIQTFSSNQIKIEPTNVLGVGKFGRINSGTIQQNETIIPIAAYSIQDKKLGQESRKSMLQELDLLIKSGKHENVIGLIGTCETSQMVIVALEYMSVNLKDFLLGSRESVPGRFSSMSEEQALDIALQITKGMAHLESAKVIHKQLCARSILMANGVTPKISGFGLAQYYAHNKVPDYTRWTAIEVFRGRPHNPRSDVWSFACLLWEICVLGGTPYGNVSNTNEIPEKIMKGQRLPQIPYFSDDLYQIMLDCWQVDPDERPNFVNVFENLQSLKDNNFIQYLSFNLTSNFQYEQFYPDMELAVRPTF